MLLIFFSSNKSDALNKIVADTSTVDTNTVGSYPITVTYKKDTYTITVNVVDTVAPTIELKEELPVVAEGDIVKAVDFVNVEDATTSAVYFIQPDNAEVEELTIVTGTNAFNIIAVDESNNRSDIVEYTIEIENVVEEKKEDELSGTSPSDNTNGGKGFDYNGKHYDTVEEYVQAIQETAKNSEGYRTQEEAMAEDKEIYGD